MAESEPLPCLDAPAECVADGAGPIGLGDVERRDIAGDVETVPAIGKGTREVAGPEPHGGIGAELREVAGTGPKRSEAERRAAAGECKADDQPRRHQLVGSRRDAIDRRGRARCAKACIRGRAIGPSIGSRPDRPDGLDPRRGRPGDRAIGHVDERGAGCGSRAAARTAHRVEHDAEESREPGEARGDRAGCGFPGDGIELLREGRPREADQRIERRRRRGAAIQRFVDTSGDICRIDAAEPVQREARAVAVHGQGHVVGAIGHAGHGAAGPRKSEGAGNAAARRQHRIGPGLKAGGREREGQACPAERCRAVDRREAGRREHIGRAGGEAERTIDRQVAGLQRAAIDGRRRIDRQVASLQRAAVDDRRRIDRAGTAQRSPGIDRDAGAANRAIDDQEAAVDGRRSRIGACPGQGEAAGSGLGETAGTAERARQDARIAAAIDRAAARGQGHGVCDRIAPAETQGRAAGAAAEFDDAGAGGDRAAELQRARADLSPAGIGVRAGQNGGAALDPHSALAGDGGVEEILAFGVVEDDPAGADAEPQLRHIQDAGGLGRGTRGGPDIDRARRTGLIGDIDDAGAVLDVDRAAIVDRQCAAAAIADDEIEPIVPLRAGAGHAQRADTARIPAEDAAIDFEAGAVRDDHVAAAGPADDGIGRVRRDLQRAARAIDGHRSRACRVSAEHHEAAGHHVGAVRDLQAACAIGANHEGKLDVPEASGAVDDSGAAARRLVAECGGLVVRPGAVEDVQEALPRIAGDVAVGRVPRRARPGERHCAR